ncbi:MAG: type IV pilus modification PilV family protein [bacterium]
MINKKKQTGFSLLEVILSALIFSFAMLSLGLMQMNGMKRAQSVELQSTANGLANNMLDSMRSDLVGVLSGFYNIDYNVTPAGGSVANDELLAWKNQLSRELPQGDGDIKCDLTYCTIKVRWDNINPLLADASSGLRNEADAPNQLELVLASRL